MSLPYVIIICGVSASGKSTIGRALADQLSLSFLEGDDYHPPANIKKMSSGEPLTDNDRETWINTICKDVNNAPDHALILSCSALTSFVQNKLISDITRKIIWIKLNLSPARALERMQARDHFMPPALMDSQFNAWSPPKGGLDVNSNQTKTAILNQITVYIHRLNNSF